MIFLDGVGIGPDDKVSNPFIKYDFKFFNGIFGETPHLNNSAISTGSKFIFPVDANLGIDGLPQSGTGQTSILCGLNASKLIGKHFGPFPYSTLVPVLEEKNIFASLLRNGKSAAYVNAFPKVFFNYLQSGKKRIGTIPLSSMLAGMKLKTASDVWKGEALTAEINNEKWRSRLNYRLPQIKPETAANRLLNISAKNDFTLFEYWITDHLGHGRYKEETEDQLNILDSFLYEVLNKLPEKMTLLICSDHGNLENISIKTHTRNPALTISAGRKAKYLADNIGSLIDIKEAVLSSIR
jgi:hypothetical protein